MSQTPLPVGFFFFPGLDSHVITSFEVAPSLWGKTSQDYSFPGRTGPGRSVGRCSCRTFNSFRASKRGPFWAFWLLGVVIGRRNVRQLDQKPCASMAKYDMDYFGVVGFFVFFQIFASMDNSITLKSRNHRTRNFFTNVSRKVNIHPRAKYKTFIQSDYPIIFLIFIRMKSWKGLASCHTVRSCLLGGLALQLGAKNLKSTQVRSWLAKRLASAKKTGGGEPLLKIFSEILSS